MNWSLLDMNCMLICLCIFQLTQGSVLEFSANPREVKEGLTSSVTLRCSLNDTSDSSAIVGRRDVTLTQNNVADVTSIILMKNGQDVASISHNLPAQQVGGNSSLQVTGSLVGGQSGRGFLEVKLINPASADNGEYQCEANGLTSTGHVVTFSSSVEISSSSPSTADLIKYVKTIEENTNRRLAEIENRIGTVSLFSVGLSKPGVIKSGQAIVYDKIFTNVGNGYNNVSGQFVCPVAGYYQFALSALSQGGHAFRLDLQHNQNNVIAIHEQDEKSWQGSSNSVVIQLSVGDTVQVASARLNSYVWSAEPDEIFTTFTGHLVAMV